MWLLAYQLPLHENDTKDLKPERSTSITLILYDCCSRKCDLSFHQQVELETVIQPRLTRSGCQVIFERPV